jgi:anti-sigma factor RsiW
VTCREFAEFIANFLDGELPPVEQQQFERHLSRCANCSRYLESYRQSTALGKRAFDDEDAEVPKDVPEELVEAILLTRRSPGPAD